MTSPEPLPSRTATAAAEEAANISFRPGTFRPAPQRASAARMFFAQARVETLMFLRHGEQQLLSLLLPLGILIGLAFLPIQWPIAAAHPIHQFFPLTLAVAATSSGLTGQAIALAFDRRYGALKRTGASGVPVWTIIAGKAAAVGVTAVIQTLVLGITAVLLGWHSSPTGIALGLVTLLLGVAAFTALGLLMGGTMASELVLGLANLVWAILLAVVGFVLYTRGLDENTWWDLVPSVALASGLTTGFSEAVPWTQWAVLIVWTGGASAAAARWFQFAE